MKRFRFNVRVYGLWVNERKILVSRETVLGRSVLKFPGGGLDFGEGLIDGLKREWQEELGISIAVRKHFYTTDYFQPSAWDDSQIISVYYSVHPLESLKFPLHNGQEYFDWLPVDDQLFERLTLPIDKLVARMLWEQTRPD
ncbi:MAG TPA: NUDIX domain-containing protein [Edaphocola sp.]|nr:NUDIX domain-containing protein [Edaphocola sp.]